MGTAAVIARFGPLVPAAAVGAAMLVAGAAPAAADAEDTGTPAVSHRAESARPAARSAAQPTGVRRAAAAHPVRAPQPAAAGRQRNSVRPVAATASGPSVSAGATGPVGGLGALLTNRTPTVTATQTGQGDRGVVTGRITAADPDSDRLTYSVVSGPAHGSVQVAADGGYVYTPDPAVAALGASDSFRVSVSDAGSGFHVHGLMGLINLLTFGLVGASGHVGTTTVGVTVRPFGVANRPPTGTVSQFEPDPLSGVVTGVVLGTDPDGDVLTYRGSGPTPKGSVAVSAGGGFTYTPSGPARENAAAPASPADLQDAFTVTVDDGRGGLTQVVVQVPVEPAAPSGTPLAAFPGAEGFGAFATGGRGGTVIYVTNLNADGPGSLQWAVDQPGARYILFKFSGVIDTQIHLTNGNVTIAGQTSPGGITIRGFVTDETPYQDQTVRAPDDFAENWMLQHIRIRPGAGGPSDDGLRLRYTRNAIVDHVSIGNATDEAIEISYSHDITVQNTLIAETVGVHSFYGGVLMNYSNPAFGFALDDVSLHHNIFNRIEGRLPEGSRESSAAAGSFMNLELSNNLYWDPRFFIALAPSTGAVTDGRGDPYPIFWKINAVNNFFRTGPAFPFGMFDDQIMRSARNQLYVSGNRMSLYPGRSDYQLFYCCNDYPAVTDPNTAGQVAQKLPARHPFPAITYTPTDQLRTVLLNTAGAWPRDPMDRRLLGFVASDTISSAPPNTNPAGDGLALPFSGAPPAAPADTDNDGMPDAWERDRGLDPTVAGANATTLSRAGYTDLEVYLQELSASRISGWAG